MFSDSEMTMRKPLRGHCEWGEEVEPYERRSHSKCDRFRDYDGSQSGSNTPAWSFSLFFFRGIFCSNKKRGTKMGRKQSKRRSFGNSVHHGDDDDDDDDFRLQFRRTTTLEGNSKSGRSRRRRRRRRQRRSQRWSLPI